MRARTRARWVAGSRPAMTVFLFGSKVRQMACKPGSVPASIREDTGGGWPFLWDVSRLTPHATYPNGYPETDYVPSLFDLAPGGACRATPVAGTAVRSYRTLSTLPDL